ncbi:hypothetical protein CMUS01_13868 [Colletotrichum musicola]|uniref:C2H2-type domain-containing protein n=1 Tax=Colletotrichum musicola TaxID=2175873 RepID=A0A8H6J9N5_9PEZI|nr:hypothetical protein CMUS01_13868 [Colletotrichum musicola]
MPTTLHPLHQFTAVENFIGILRPPIAASLTASLLSPYHHADTSSLPTGFNAALPEEPLPSIDSVGPVPHSTETTEGYHSEVSLSHLSPLPTDSTVLGPAAASLSWSNSSVDGTLAITPEVDGRRRKSRRSHNGSFYCERGCHSVFTSPKDLRRHYNSGAHVQPTSKKYRCRCDYSTTRKDHYRRHLRNISAGRTCNFSQPYFYCICEYPVVEIDSQRQIRHIDTCLEGRGRSGRPRGTT